MDKIEALLVKNGYRYHSARHFYQNFGKTSAFVILYNNFLVVDFSQTEEGQNQVIFSGNIEKTEESVKAFISLVESYNKFSSYLLD